MAIPIYVAEAAPEEVRGRLAGWEPKWGRGAETGFVG